MLWCLFRVLPCLWGFLHKTSPEWQYCTSELNLLQQHWLKPARINLKLSFFQGSSPRSKAKSIILLGSLTRDLSPQPVKLLCATSQNPEHDNTWTNRFCYYLVKKAKSQLSRSTSLKCCSFCTEKHKFTTRDKESPELICKVGSISAGFNMQAAGKRDLLHWIPY